MNNFNGKAAVITGAASGIGLALAKYAAAQGMNLVLADIDETALKTAVDQLNLPADRVLTARTDVRHASEIKALADAIKCAADVLAGKVRGRLVVDVNR